MAITARSSNKVKPQRSPPHLIVLARYVMVASTEKVAYSGRPDPCHSTRKAMGFGNSSGSPIFSEGAGRSVPLTTTNEITFLPGTKPFGISIV